MTPSSANLATAITDETGSGLLVFATSPTFTTSVTTGSTTFACFNTNATTVNAFGAATTLNVGAGAAATATFAFTTAINLNTAAIVSNQTTVAVINTNATTVNAFGAATTLNIGAATGTCTIANALLSIKTMSMTVTANTGLTITDGTLTGIIFASTGPVLSIGATSNHGVNFYSNNAIRLSITNAGVVTVAQNLTLSSTLTYGGVTLTNAVTGTGKMVLDTAPVFASTVSVTGALSPLALLDISGASAGQIKFPATQNASADANTLDDYEEGTWTPVLAFGGASVGIAYTTQTGRYTKVGRKVCIEINIVTSSKGSSTGNATITGAPFAQGITTANHPIWIAGVTLTGNSSVQFTTSTLTLQTVSDAGTATTLTDAQFGAVNVVSGTISYSI